MHAFDVVRSAIITDSIFGFCVAVKMVELRRGEIACDARSAREDLREVPSLGVPSHIWESVRTATTRHCFEVLRVVGVLGS